MSDNDIHVLEMRGLWINKIINSYTRIELDSMFERVLDGLDHTDYDGRTKYTSVFEAMLNPRRHEYPTATMDRYQRKVNSSRG